MDLSAIVAPLIANGPMGMLALFLWNRELNTSKRYEESQKEFIKELIRITGVGTDAIRASTEGFRSNTEVQSRAAQSAASIAEALRALEASIEHFSAALVRIENRIERLEHGGRS